MADPRVSQLADVLVNHSCQLKAGEKVLIEAFDLKDTEIVCRIVETVAQQGAIPVVNLKQNKVLRSQYRTATQESMTLQGELEAHAMSHMDAYIGIRGADNSNEFVDVPTEKMDLFQAHWWTPVHLGVRVPNTRWVVLRYPTPSMAQSANMSTEAFEEYYFNVCTTDYAQMAVDQKPLAEVDGPHRQSSHRRSRHRSVIFDQGTSCDPVCGRVQHPRRRSLHSARP